VQAKAAGGAAGPVRPPAAAPIATAVQRRVVKDIMRRTRIRPGGRLYRTSTYLEGGRVYDRRWLREAMDSMGMHAILPPMEVGAAAWQKFEDDVESVLDIRATELHDACIAAVERNLRRARTLAEASQISTLTPQAYTPFAMETHNVEKFGKATDKESKTIEFAEEIEVTAPDFMSFQEVTDPELFMGYMEGEAEDYVKLEGPHYKSYKYNENYPGAFNTATVHKEPKLFYVDPNTKEEKPYEKTLYFGKEKADREGDSNLKQARPTTFWDFEIPADQRNLRPPRKWFNDPRRERAYERSHGNLAHRVNKPYQRVRVINVHTSPGKSTPTIHRQVNDILSDQRSMIEDVPNTASIGDYYMQKGSKTNWKNLNNGTGDLMAIDPGVNTNFKKGEGKQTADHPVVPRTWKGNKAWALPPLQSAFESLEEKLERGKNESELAKWEQSDIDHATVYSRSSVPVETHVQQLSEILNRFFAKLRYMQNNCLIHAIAEAAGVALSQQVIDQIRNDLLRFCGIPIGSFVQSNQNTVRIIMAHLGIHGILYVQNVDNANHLPLPIYVQQQVWTSANVVLNINYSSSHFYASPG
jgi:hypothetical protein